jgi:hypothetical protein
MSQFNKYLEIIQEMEAAETKKQPGWWKPTFINFIKTNLNAFHQELKGRISAGPAQKTCDLNVKITAEDFDMLKTLNSEVSKGIIQINGKIKLNESNSIKMFWDDLLEILINPKNNNNYLSQSDFKQIGFTDNTLYGFYKMNGASVGNFKDYKNTNQSKL